MTNTNITSARSNLFKIAESCIKYNDVVNINTKDGNVIMLSEAEYNGLIETINLCKIPNLEKSLINIKNAPEKDFMEININEL
ncbi:MAG: type II toxin-antitoxin system Phd/YefM family antitoxin [Clostridia bacterium]|nr:type II toxin-antitoxin system Phd/YefM family antitoxin [Clostridia bacterium]